MIIPAEWPGYIIEIFVAEGREVDEDEQLMLLEGTDDSRTQFFLYAPESGKVKKILVNDGDFVQEGDDLIEIGESD